MRIRRRSPPPDPAVRWTVRAGAGLIMLAAVIAAVAVAACTPADAAPPAPKLNLEVAQAAGDTFPVYARWDTLQWSGSVIHTYARIVGDSAGTFSDSLDMEAVAADTAWFPVPDPGTTRGYFYCIRAHPVSSRIGPRVCGGFRVTRLDTTAVPAPNLQVSPGSDTLAALLQLDSLTVTPDSLAVRNFQVTLAGDTSAYVLAYDRHVRVDSVAGHSYQLTALLWEGGRVVGCGGNCSAYDPSSLFYLASWGWVDRARRWRGDAREPVWTVNDRRVEQELVQRLRRETMRYVGS